MNGIVPIELYNGNGFECLAQDTQCPYTSECTNHMSAGDFRMEWGMQPLLTIVDVNKKFLICSTRGSEPSPTTEWNHPSQVQPSICFGYGEMLGLDEVNTQQLTLPF